LKEANAIFGREKLVTQIISLGCGHSHISLVERNKNSEGVDRTVEEMAVDCEAVAKELSTRLCDMDAYLRLNVERGMENVPMNKWAELGPIETHTDAYVETADTSETIEVSLRRLQGNTGTVTLGEISAYSYTVQGFCARFIYTDVGQIIQGLRRRCKTSSTSTRRIWIVPSGL
jgi:hypothetical protein